MKLITNYLAARKSKARIAKYVALETKTRMQIAFLTGMVEGAIERAPTLNSEQCETDLVEAASLRASLSAVEPTEYNAVRHHALIAKLNSYESTLRERIGGLS